MTLSLILDIVVAAMLGAVVWYCVLLNYRLANLRAGHEELAALIDGLNKAIAGAQKSVAMLRETGEKAGNDLREETDKARNLRDELALIIGSGNNLAARLETRLVGGSGSHPAPAGPDDADGPAAGIDDDEDREAEQNILRALSGAR